MFGIPGSVTSVVLLSAMLMKGIIPGASVLAPEAHGGHLGFVFSLVAFLVMANAVVVAVFLRLLAPLSRIATVRGPLLFPGVVVLMLVGAFMDKNALEDLLVVAAAGALGWVMMRLDWPRPPLLLGLALGPLAENRLFLSTSLYGWSWLHRPGVLIIGALAVVFLWRGFVRRASVPPDAMHGHADAGAPRAAHAVFLGVLMTAAAIAFAGTWGFSARAAVFPRLALGTVLALGAAQAILMWRQRARMPQDGRAPGTTASGVVWTGAMLAAIWSLGFAAGAPLVVFAYLRFGARERWWVALAQACCVYAFLHGVLVTALAVPLPAGMLFRLL
jgi:TctA family transporter